MSNDQFEKQMKREEALHGKEIAEAITAALNASSTIASADKINGMCNGWPYEPTREMLRLYQKVADKAWSKMKKGYGHMVVSIEILAPSGGTPYATATAKFDGEWKGGFCHMLGKGETIAGLAKEVYGFDCYAENIWDANAKVLGNSCRQLPADFTIDVPQIWVPNWKDAPKASMPAGAKAKAVKILYPTMEVDFSSSRSAVQVIPLGPVTLMITYEVKGTVKAQIKGTIAGSFNLRSYTADISKTVGGVLGGSYSVDLKEGKGTAGLTLSNSSIKGLSMSQSISLKPGSLKVTFGKKTISGTHKDLVYEGTIEASADIKIIPTPRFEPVKVRKPVRVRKEVVIGVAILACVVVVGVSIVSAGSGAAPAAAGASALVLGLSAS